MCKTLKLVLFLVLSFFAYAFAEESLTITTYYPSPYGSYRELRAKRIAIGDNYIDGGKYNWEGTGTIASMDASTNLIVEGNVGIGTAKPQARLDINSGVANTNNGIRIGHVPDNQCVAGTVGTIRYNPGNAKVEYCNGVKWKLAFEAKKILGAVDSRGIRINGTGFTSQVQVPCGAAPYCGRYIVNFNSPFDRPPVVVVSSNQVGAALWCSVYEMATDHFRVFCSAWNGAAYDRPFTFIAEEPQ